MLDVFRFLFGPLFLYLVTAAFPFADLFWFFKDPSSPTAFAPSMFDVFWTIVVTVMIARCKQLKSILAESSKLTLAVGVFAIRAVIQTRDFYGLATEWYHWILLGVLLVAAVPLLAIYSLKWLLPKVSTVPGSANDSDTVVIYLKCLWVNVVAVAAQFKQAYTRFKWIPPALPVQGRDEGESREHSETETVHPPTGGESPPPYQHRLKH
ncbi:hypothetical protein C8J56DRAFT_1058588 [Mycena floridula]|nr:hypothetical protein C8J56DRAFT_1058588 [Mycena floridula]